MMGRILYLALLCMCWTSMIWSQTPFRCDGTVYFLLNPTSTSVMNIYGFDAETQLQSIDFVTPIQNNFLVNAAGYRISDNLIYGIESGRLVRIDATGAVEVLRNLSDVQNSRILRAGDITPDGKYLVLIGTNNNGSLDRTILFIDLEDTSYPVTRTIPLTGQRTQVSDVAFSPLTGELYGYDYTQNVFALFNLETGVVEKISVSDSDVRYMGGLAYSPAGNLLGYGPLPNAFYQEGVYQANPATGEIVRIAGGPLSNVVDACSCPYTFNVRAWANQSDLNPCTEFTINLELTNSMGRPLEGINFKYPATEGFTITKVKNLNDGTEITDVTLINQLLSIQNFTVPLGQQRLELTVEVKPEVAGQFKFQAILDNLPSYLGTRVYSDNPYTDILNDPIVINVDFPDVEPTIRTVKKCPEEEMELHPTVEGRVLKWNSGSAATTVIAQDEGWYSVTLTDGCELAIEEILVEDYSLDVALGDDKTIEYGETITLEPSVEGDAQHVVYRWTSSNQEQLCLDCATNSIRPNASGLYSVTITDEYGCTANTSVFVEVDKDRDVYLPNAFSPNGDGENDYFFISTERPKHIRSFQIFDRWGQLLYEQHGVSTNDATLGWDGKFRGQLLPVGSYVYTAEIEFPDGYRKVYTGSVRLF